MLSPRNIAILILTLPVAFCASASAPPEEPAADFALRLDHKGCKYEYLDTFNGTFGRKTPIPFVLSAEERHTLFAAVIAADFFQRPSDLGTGKHPSTNFELEVRNAGVRHSVRWTAESKWGQSEDATPLWHLQRAIFDVLESHVGSSGCGCKVKD
jgi:hypothetical protein